MNSLELNAQAQVMKALASPVRLKIVEALSEGERCLCELRPLLTKDKSTLSRHVAVLRNAGIVRERREGVRCYLKLATPCVLGIFACMAGVLRTEAKRQAEISGTGKFL